MEDTTTDTKCKYSSSANDATWAVHYRHATHSQQSSVNAEEWAVHPTAPDILCA